MSKNNVITMRISTEQLDKLIERIKNDHIKSKSEFIRAAINDKLKKRSNEHQKTK